MRKAEIAVFVVTMCLLSMARSYSEHFGWGVAVGALYGIFIMLLSNDAQPTPTTEDKGREDLA